LRHFHPSLIFVIQTEALHDAHTLKVVFLFTRYTSKKGYLPTSHTPAYCTFVQITSVKSCVVPAPGGREKQRKTDFAGLDGEILDWGAETGGGAQG
jgi:hypothetical protein